MPPHVPKPGASDTGPRGVRIADSGYGSPITLQYMPVDKIRVGKRHRKNMGDLNAQLSRHELLAAPNIGRAASAAVVLWWQRYVPRAELVFIRRQENPFHRRRRAGRQIAGAGNLSLFLGLRGRVALENAVRCGLGALMIPASTVKSDRSALKLEEACSARP